MSCEDDDEGSSMAFRLLRRDFLMSAGCLRLPFKGSRSVWSSSSESSSLSYPAFRLGMSAGLTRTRGRSSSRHVAVDVSDEMT